MSEKEEKNKTGIIGMVDNDVDDLVNLIQEYN